MCGGCLYGDVYVYGTTSTKHKQFVERSNKLKSTWLIENYLEICDRE